MAVDDETDFFASYAETTVDPGWSFIVGVSTACLLLNLMLPCLVTLGGRYEMRRKRLGGAKSQAGDTDNEGGEFGEVASDIKNSRSRQDKVVIVDMKRVRAPSESRARDEEAIEVDNASQSLYSVRSGSGRRERARSGAHDRDAPSVISSTQRSAIGAASEWMLGLADKVIIPSYPNEFDRRSKSSERLVSNGTSVVSVTTGGSSLSGALLNGRPHRAGNHASRAVLDRLEYSSTYSSNRGVPQRRRLGGTGTPAKAPSARSGRRGDTLSVRFGRRGARTQASNRGSAMSRLDPDDVSFNDAIDHYAPGRYLLPTGEGSGEVDLCCGEHAWWKPSMISSGFDRIVGTAEWDEEVGEIIKLAVPYSLQSLMYGIFGTLNLSLLGHLVGTKEANAYIIITLLSEVTNTLNYGFHESLGTLLPRAIGAENEKLGGAYLNTAMALYTIGSIPSALIWSFGAARSATLWFGFDEATADVAQLYCYSYVVLEWLGGLRSCLSTFLSVSGHEKYSTVTQLVDHVLSTCAFAIPPLVGRANLPTIGAAQVIFVFFSLFANAIIIAWVGWFDGFWDGLVTLPFRNVGAVKTVFKTSAPLGVAWLLTYGEWELLTIFASHLGPAEVAAWGYLGYIWSMLEYFSDGIADGSEVRCSYHLGANNPEIARLSSYKSIYLGFVSSLCATALIFLLSENLVAWVTPDPTIQRLMLELLPLVGIGQIAMTTGVMSWALVGAQGRYRLATTIQFIGSWGLTLPLSCLFTFVLNINLQGLTAALVLGYTLAGTGNSYVLLRSEWARIAEIISAENAIDDSDASTDQSGSTGSPGKSDSSPGKDVGKAKPRNLLGRDDRSDSGDEDDVAFTMR